MEAVPYCTMRPRIDYGHVVFRFFLAIFSVRSSVFLYKIASDFALFAGPGLRTSSTGKETHAPSIFCTPYSAQQQSLTLSDTGGVAETLAFRTQGSVRPSALSLLTGERRHSASVAATAVTREARSAGIGRDEPAKERRKNCKQND